MEQHAQSLLIVAGIKHLLEKVLTMSKTMPSIEAKTAEFLPFDSVQVATVEPANPKLNHGEVVLYKREGKWIIITGRESVRRAVETGAATFRARLLSAQALKRCKMDYFKHPDDGKPLPAPTPTYTEEFRNAPRIVDRRPARESEYFNKPHPTHERSSSAMLASKHGYSGGDSSGVKKILNPSLAEIGGYSNTPRGPYGNRKIRVEEK